tara:strand:+ start:296 stop:802 length:507 start_codon:yes stop_codon:yes gene_type:complete
MNRERFHEVQERIEQVINVLGQHDVTATILETLATKDHTSPMKMHVSIGAGVTLTCQHPGGGEGTTIVDLGSGIFGERSWSDAAALTRERMEELGALLENLQSQSQQLEATVTNLAQSFNSATEMMKREEASDSQEAAKGDDLPMELPEAKQQRRRGGMFGNELTLDD